MSEDKAPRRGINYDALYEPPKGHEGAAPAKAGPVSGGGLSLDGFFATPPAEAEPRVAKEETPAKAGARGVPSLDGFFAPPKGRDTPEE
ncbi:hypothetical protein [Pseudoroseicyclus tamaricis]|uniref:Uncharacterized protein n=1 Tax=Pseudoroseicyclus tamaricis TaxID=2705421 RepID=A0A6B2JFS6_9RHOB|nr:hypothetical protein [Pseudoroseicyclus tamaricis]NDU99940.1 hypothetical protein [Pseudoroseicyclus tamaricis]